MCGIVGQFGPVPGDSHRWLDAAVASIHHRGPDDEGTWSDDEAEVLLGFRRLAIVDLSAGGHQPLVSEDGRFVLVFNGEIYNYKSLRGEHEQAGHRFRTTSDTEVLMVSIQRWGLVEALRRSNGMFALALWDSKQRVLGLARDRLGEKPLFVQRIGSAVRFASELKALRAGGQAAPEIDRAALGTYLRLGYVPAPHSIHVGITKVVPGTVRWIRDGRDVDEPYWELPELGLGRSATDSFEELVHLLTDSVALRMQADVPVGAFLSGGIDSSLIASLMVARGGAVRTFTIGFDERGFDESQHARAVASHLGTEHTELRVSPADAQAVVPLLPVLFDEPFADQSAIPTFLVAELARRQVTVALSGDGGDELFGGYTRYRRLALGAPLTFIPSPAATALAGGARFAGRRFPRLSARARTIERVGLGLEAGGSHGLYRGLVSLWEDPAEVMVVPGEYPNSLTDGSRWPFSSQSLVRHAMGADLSTYLPDDILVKVDRTSMAVGLEARVPFLDHRIVEWSRRNARPSVRREYDMKAPLRTALEQFVPRDLFDRPKMGFGAPVGEWLRGPLRGWADELLDPVVIRSQGLLRSEPIRSRWASHLAGYTDQSFPLWTILSFQAWYREWM